jgi:uncharacterized protein with ACT and thioredoxin-like domain
VVAVDRRGERGSVDTVEVVAGGECVCDQLVELAQRVDALLRPAPLALGGGVGDGLELSQDVSIIPISG